MTNTITLSRQAEDVEVSRNGTRDTIAAPATPAPRKRRGDHKDDDALHLDPLPDDELIVLICRVGAHYRFDASEYRSAFSAAARSPEPARIAYRDIAKQLFGHQPISKEVAP